MELLAKREIIMERIAFERQDAIREARQGPDDAHHQALVGS